VSIANDVVIVTGYEVGALVFGLLCVVVAAIASTTPRQDRTLSINWGIAGFAALGAGSIALAVLNWRWLIAVVVIGGLAILVAAFTGEWREAPTDGDSRARSPH
jgi:hypothetical protein